MPKLIHLEAVLMENGEIICSGKTIGWVEDLHKFVHDPEETYTQVREATEEELARIASDISEGNTSGIIDTDDSYRCAWQLQLNIWEYTREA